MRREDKDMDIDFVITYLDGNDVEWQKEKNKYSPSGITDINPNRYRNWDNLKYFFRAIEKNAPWVRKIHFVTCGHYPKWLNLDNPKLNIVKHEEYIPKEWLPTFSSRCIDMNLHRIRELAEHFVYFNDDMFIIKPVTKRDFFVEGLPCDTAIISPSGYKYQNGLKLNLAPILDVAVLNKNFSKKNVVKKNISKWINYRYYKYNLTTFAMLPYNNFVGFLDQHLPYSYLKSTYNTVWEHESELLEKTVSHRFREMTDLNHWIFSYWQFATGRFFPRSTKFGKCFQIHNIQNANIAKDCILKQTHKVICLNDAIVDENEADEIIRMLNVALNNLYPDKSSFEV